MSSDFAKKSERTICSPLASRSVLLRIVRCKPPHLRCEPSASGSQLKRRSDEMNELRLFQKVGANDMQSAPTWCRRRGSNPHGAATEGF